MGLGIGGVLLTILQGAVFNHYCTMCLCSAACSVLMVGFALAEVLATLQYLKRVRQNGGSLNQAVWGAAGASRRGRTTPTPRNIQEFQRCRRVCTTWFSAFGS